MGVRFPSVFSSTSQGNPAAALETVVCISPPISQSVDNAFIYLICHVNASAIGTTGNFMTLRLRRGTTTAGVQVSNTPGITVVAGGGYMIAGVYQDGPGVVAGQQYCVTIQISAATAPTTIADVGLLAMVL